MIACFLHTWPQTTTLGAILESGLSAISSNRNIFPEYETLV
jgi:hypothetical protein